MTAISVNKPFSAPGQAYVGRSWIDVDADVLKSSINRPITITDLIRMI